jgi:hypothetical protein
MRGGGVPKHAPSGELATAGMESDVVGLSPSGGEIQRVCVAPQVTRHLFPACIQCLAGLQPQFISRPCIPPQFLQVMRQLFRYFGTHGRRGGMVQVYDLVRHGAEYAMAPSNIQYPTLNIQFPSGGALFSGQHVHSDSICPVEFKDR